MYTNAPLNTPYTHPHIRPKIHYIPPPLHHYMIGTSLPTPSMLWPTLDTLSAVSLVSSAATPSNTPPHSVPPYQGGAYTAMATLATTTMAAGGGMSTCVWTTRRLFKTIYYCGTT